MNVILLKRILFYFFILKNSLCDNEIIVLTVLHSNDIHGNFAPDDDGFGGIPRTMHVLKKMKALSTDINPIIYLNAGDIFTGTVWYSIHRTAIAADFVKLMKADAFTLGNHEFDEGLDGLEHFCSKLSQPILCANGNFSLEPNIEKYIQPSIIIKPVNTNIQIGVIGYINSRTASLTNTGNITFSDDIEAVRKEAAILSSKGVKIIIALGHSGIENDKKIGELIDEVDLIVGGHSHTFLFTGTPPTKDVPYDNYPVIVKKPNGVLVPVVQVGYGGKYLGMLNLTIDSKGNVLEFNGEPILLDSKIPDDQEALELLNFYRPVVEALLREIIGKSKVYLQGGLYCRRLECNLGNLLTDAMCVYKADLTEGLFWTDTPIGVINGGAIRSSINASKRSGAVAKGDVLAALPYTSKLVTITLNSTMLLKMLEFSVSSNGETSYGEFLQVSGLKVTFDLFKPPFNRVESVLIRCANCDVPKYEPIKENGVYKIITTKYLAMGGDGYSFLKDPTIDLVQEDDTSNGVFFAYLKDNAVSTNLDDRVQMKRRIPSPRVLNIGNLSSRRNLVVIFEIICLVHIVLRF